MNLRPFGPEAGYNGLWLLDVETHHSPGMSESLNQISEALVHSELERYLRKAKAILTQAEYPNIIEPIGNRSIYKESNLVFIPVENLKKIGCGTFSEIQHFLLEITEFAKLATQHLRYQ